MTRFEVYEAIDASIEGIYQIRLEGKLSDLVHVAQSDFTLVVYGCKASTIELDFAQTTSTAEDYTIGTGPVEYNFQFSQSQVGCTTTYALTETGGAYDSVVISFDTATGALTLDIPYSLSDTYKDQSMTLVVTATAVEAFTANPTVSAGDMTASYEFTVNFLNPCNDLSNFNAPTLN